MVTVTIAGAGWGPALRSELLMDPTLAARALSAATEITSTALSGDDPEGVLETVVARAAELADADLGLAMVSAEDGRVVVEAAYRATDAEAGLHQKQASTESPPIRMPTPWAYLMVGLPGLIAQEARVKTTALVNLLV